MFYTGYLFILPAKLRIIFENAMLFCEKKEIATNGCHEVMVNPLRSNG